MRVAVDKEKQNRLTQAGIGLLSEETHKPRDADTKGEGSLSTVDQAAKVGPLRFTTTSLTNLTFGHGRHACPGRFLVDFQLKMVIAYVVTRYKLSFPYSHKGMRPENMWIADVKAPRHVKINVRRNEN